MRDVTRIGSPCTGPWTRDEGAPSPTTSGPPKLSSAGSTSSSAPSASSSPRDVASLPPLPDTDGDLLARAVRLATTSGAPAAAPRPLVAMGIEATAVEVPDCDTAVTKRLDAFRATATPVYRVPGEGEVAVAGALRPAPVASAAVDVPVLP